MNDKIIGLLKSKITKKNRFRSTSAISEHNTLIELQIDSLELIKLLYEIKLELCLEIELESIAKIRPDSKLEDLTTLFTSPRENNLA